MKRLQILVYNPWNTDDQDISWGVGYHDYNLYDIINKIRNEYPMHCATFFFENDMIKTYKPLYRDQIYI